MTTIVMTRPLSRRLVLVSLLGRRLLEPGLALLRDLLLQALLPLLVQARTKTTQTAGPLNTATVTRIAPGPETGKVQTVLVSPCLQLNMLAITKVLQADLTLLTFQSHRVQILTRQVLPFRTTTCIARTCTSPTTTQNGCSYQLKSDLLQLSCSLSTCTKACGTPVDIMSLTSSPAVL